ncbi:pseudoazurin [Sphingomonas psychrotolerans]|uniref:Pseudoazurin n=1 Tax=Sphingomonas psychrotolerans TaxID=1327635 RepID=A0A2K8MKK9_9SPHN|nr:pseudoazurin [Sphingomonas psychrotolerans]ATY33544.1 pseudoazurin [Sphingomonas psychrotolerans]
MRITALKISAVALAVALPAVAAFALGSPGAPAPAAAPAATVKMLNRGAAGMMVFESAIVRIKPGQSVTFTPNDMGHNVETIPGMLPAGAQPFKGALSKPLTVTFTKPGVYGFKCAPHLSMGMVGVVIVGNPANLAQAKAVSLPGKAKPVMAGLLAGVR